MKKVLFLFTLIVLLSLNSLVMATTLTFEDYGEPVFGPANTEEYYYGFHLPGWRVYNKDGVLSTYGASSYLYAGTNGNRSIGRNSYDPKFISRIDDFYFNGATITSFKGAHANNAIVELIGYNNGSQVWYETLEFSGSVNVAEVKNFTSSYSTIAVDSIRFHSWQEHLHQFVLDDFIYTDISQGGGPDPVPEPSTILLFGVGLLGLVRVTRKK